MTERESELSAMIQELIYVMHVWGCEGDGIPEEAYPSFLEAAGLSNVPRKITINEDNDVIYKLDKRWLQLQRLTQDMRKEQHERELKEGSLSVDLPIYSVGQRVAAKIEREGIIRTIEDDVEYPKSPVLIVEFGDGSVEDFDVDDEDIQPLKDGQNVYRF